ncbi:hypothetical protein LTR94_035607, partial [Friedmanniomyces endolithicus]
AEAEPDPADQRFRGPGLGRAGRARRRTGVPGRPGPGRSPRRRRPGRTGHGFRRLRPGARRPRPRDGPAQRGRPRLFRPRRRSRGRSPAHPAPPLRP